jgi:outer membrane protein assembly factor BamA
MSVFVRVRPWLKSESPVFLPGWICFFFLNNYNSKLFQVNEDTMRKTIYTILTLLIAVNFSFLKAGNGSENNPAKKKCKNRIVASPFAFYTPETSVAFGGAGSYVFRVDKCKNENTRPSSISPVIIYTLKKQFKVQLGTELFFPNNSYQLKADVKFEKFPFKFYGIGIDTLEEDEEVYTPRNTAFFLSFLKNLGKGFYAGLQYQLINWNIIEKEAGRQLDSGLIAGSEEGTVSGVSLVLRRDTRDHIYFPVKGDLFEFNARFYPEFLGSTMEYSTLTLDLRKYISLFSTHVFAVQGLMKAQSGTVPFFDLAGFGGEYLMRGYYQGRFRDKNMLVFQAEYRLPLFRRFGAVGFAGAGTVAGRFSELGSGDLKFSYGFGLRYLFDKKEKIRIRMDFAFGEGTSGFYFSVFEAF